MPVFNSAAHLRAAIESILQQSFGDLELIVVDDGSTDETGQILKSFADPRIRCFSQANQGPAAARNLGLEKARAPYVAFFDSDDISRTDRLQRERDYLCANRSCRAVGSLVENIDPAGRSLGVIWGYQGPQAGLAPTMLFENCLSTSTMFIERAALDGLRFNPELPVASDYDVWVRLLERISIANLPVPLVQYRVHPANISHKKRDLLEGCVRQVVRYQLKPLGIDPTDRELQIHRSLLECGIDLPIEQVNEFESWLLKLTAANNRTGRYDKLPFQQVLSGYWHAVCQRACIHGWWTWRKWWNSPLRLGGRMPLPAQARMASLALRAVLKKKFPGFGSQVRSE